MPDRAKMILEELLKEFQGNEPDDVMILHLGGPIHGTGILTFWPMADVQWEEPARPYPARKSERWEWLWEGVQYDLQKLSAYVGAPPYLLRTRVRLFAGWRWIWPDGTVAPKVLERLAEESNRAKATADGPSASKPN